MDKLIKKLMTTGVCLAVIGIICLLGGIYCFVQSIDIRQSYKSGNRSAKSLYEQIGVRSESDFVTKREKALAQVISIIDADRIYMVQPAIWASCLLLFMGISFLYMGANQIFVTKCLRENIAQPTAREDRLAHPGGSSNDKAKSKR
jgi:uncharacterized membrane protein HdeD (DUF308 family)